MPQLSNPFTLSRARQIWFVLFTLLLVTTVFPVYVPKHQTVAVSYFGLLHYASVGIVVLPILLAGLVALLVAGKRSWVIANVLLFLGASGLLALNAFTDTNATTPEPYTTIVILLYVVAAPLMAIGAFLAAALGSRLKERRQTFAEAYRAASEVAAAKRAKPKVAQSQVRAPKAKTMKVPAEGSVNHEKAALYAVLGPVCGVLLTLVFWQMGFIASIAAYVMVWLTVRLYRYGAGSSTVDSTALWAILGYTIAGVLLSFFAMFTSDTLEAVNQWHTFGKDATTFSILTDSRFWSINATYLHDGAVLGGYARDFAIAVVFSTLGLYSTLRDVVLDHKTAKLAAAEPSRNAGKQKQRPDDWMV